MKPKHFAGIVVSAAMIAAPATKVSADAGDFIAGAIIGGIVGHAATKNNNTQRKTYRSTRPTLPVTQEGRLIQSSLNYFGFNAGAVDGQLGRRSRAAISQYQAHMGYPVTGQLSLYERDFLFTSYERAQAGGSLTLQQIAAHPMGARGLLHVYRDQAAGIATAAAPMPNTVVVPAPATTVVTVAPTTPAPAPVEPAPETTMAAAPSLPNFGGSAPSVSLASHCNGVSLLTNSNGGFTTVSTMTNPEFALSEQFCLARTYAIANGEEMVADMGGVTPAQVAEQCAAFGPAMQEQLVAVASQPMAAVLQSTSKFVISSGMPAANLKSTAKVCLSSGYRTDDLDVALGSALILVSLGAAPYGELVGHHLQHGFGVAKRGDLAQPWYNAAISAIEAGAQPAFNPGQPERTTLVKAAASGMSTGGAAGAIQPKAASTLPTFGLSSD